MPMDPKQLKAFAGKAKPKAPPPAAEEPPPEEVAEQEGVENTGETAGDGDETTDEQLAQDVMAKVTGGDLDEELAELVESGEAVDGTFPWVQEPEIWDRAQKSLDPDEIPQGTNPFVVLAHIYMAMGGHVEGLSDQEAEEPGGEMHEEPDADDAAEPPPLEE